MTSALPLARWRAIGNYPDPSLTAGINNRGLPGWRSARLGRDDGRMQERTSSAPYWSPATDRSDGSGQAHAGHWQSWIESRARRWTRGPGNEGPFRRERENQLAGGIAAGIAAKTGFDVSAVRLVLIVATLVTGGLAAAG